MLKKEKFLLGILGTSFGFYLATQVKNLYHSARIDARKEALEFAREHRLGGTLLDVGKALIDFHGEKIQDMFVLGFLTGTVIVLAVVFSLIFYSAYTNDSKELSRKEYLELKDKAYLYDSYFSGLNKEYQTSQTKTNGNYRESERETTKI